MRKIIKKITNALRGISNFLRKTSIKNRLIASFSVGIIFCSSILGILLYKKATNALKNNAINYSENMLSIMSEDIYKNKEFLERASIELSMNEEIANNLINYKFMDAKEKNEFLKYMNDYLSKKLSLLPNLAEVEIISKDYEVTYMQGFKYFKREDIERYADESENGLFWFSTLLNNEPHICIVTQVKQDNSIVGYVFMAIKSEVFASSFSLFNIGKGSEIFIIDEKNNIIISENNLNSNFILEEPDLNKFLKNKDSKDTARSIVVNGKNYVATYKKLKGFNWYIASMTPYDFINADIQSLRKEMTIIGLLFTLVVLISSYFLYSSIKVPLYNLLNKMKRVSEGDLKVLVNDTYEDEIGVISDNFDSMLKRVNELIEKTKLQEIEKRDLEIRMLQAQINPHFLFNTLNSLKWTALMNQDYTVSEGLSSLAELLRNTIIDKNELVTIREELENIKNYVVIQKIRYGNSFDVEYEVDELLLENKVIKFILQPIVENSIIHGIDENKENQKIIIKIMSEEENILISIKDNGKGFNSKEKVKDNKLSGIGWNNVDERIKLTFGLGYGTTIYSEVNKGTIVKIVIPKSI